MSMTRLSASMDMDTNMNNSLPSPQPLHAASALDDLPTSFGSRKRPYSTSQSQKGAQQNCVDFDAKVNEHFNKKFHFKPRGDEWELPKPENMFAAIKWKDNHLQRFKTKLNSVKNKLNDYNLDDWQRHTRFTNKAGEVQWRIRNDFEPEFVTQAWCKFYENVMSFPLIPTNVTDGDHICSVHLCEAPGAFVTSLNHYLKTNHPNVSWDWVATTLNPHYEGNPLSCMINDDRFIMQTLDHWSFGQDATGDLMCLKNMTHLMDKVRNRGKVMLVTADGSIDCQGDPGEQETVVSRLHYCETVTALHLLAPGGSFLLKMFTMFECDTICLMYLLCCAFKNVSVNKPVTSKEGNSEVYVVCLEYRGVDFMQHWLTVLRKNFGPVTLRNSMFISLTLPVDFLEQLEDCAEQFTNYQIEVIESNIWTFTHRKENNHVVKRLRHLIAQRFVEVYQIRHLDASLEIVGRKILKQMETPNIEPRSTSGSSFNDRVMKDALPPLMMLSALKEEMKALNIRWSSQEDIKWLQFPDERIEATILTGMPVATVLSSKFCFGKLLNICNRARQLETHHSTLLDQTGSAVSLMGADIGGHSQFVNNLKLQFSDAVVLDFKSSLWTSLYGGNYSTSEGEAFLRIKMTLNTLKRGSTLIVVGYPMITQFNVGMIYMIGHLFKKLGFVRPTGQDFAVVFQELRRRDAVSLCFFHSVEYYVNLCHGEESVGVLAVLPIALLCGISQLVGDSLVEEESNATIGNGPKGFYSCVLEMNNHCVQEQVTDIIANVLKE